MDTKNKWEGSDRMNLYVSDMDYGDD